MTDAEGANLTVNVTEFKAKCLDLLSRLDTGTLARVTITRRGKPVAVVEPPAARGIKGSAHGFLRGAIRIAPGVDLTGPVIDEEPQDPFFGRIKRRRASKRR